MKSGEADKPKPCFRKDSNELLSSGRAKLWKLRWLIYKERNQCYEKCIKDI
ncbi:hypothetical protein MUO65_01775 [bacterium]|nr:hypothetical protein [bacterium]